jgi:hypothetical protein
MREGRNAALAGHFTTWWRMPPPRLVEDVAVAREFPEDQHADFPVRVPVRATFEKSRCAFRLRDNRERTMTDTPMSTGSDETAGPEEEEFMERVIAPALLELEKWLGHIPTEAEFSE